MRLATGSVEFARAQLSGGEETAAREIVCEASGLPALETRRGYEGLGKETAEKGTTCKGLNWR